jgi:hypothetical protein
MQAIEDKCTIAKQFKLSKNNRSAPFCGKLQVGFAEQAWLALPIAQIPAPLM